VDKEKVDLLRVREQATENLLTYFAKSHQDNKHPNKKSPSNLSWTQLAYREGGGGQGRRSCYGSLDEIWKSINQPFMNSSKGSRG